MGLLGQLAWPAYGSEFHVLCVRPSGRLADVLVRISRLLGPREFHAAKFTFPGGVKFTHS